MRRPAYTRAFERDLKRMFRRGKNSARIKAVMLDLIEGRPLEPRLRDHFLSNNFAGRRECHIEPDWLLIYKLEPEEIIFERTGTHADLFD